MLLRLPTSPVGKSHQKSQAHVSADPIPSKKQKQDETFRDADFDNDDDSFVGDSTDGGGDMEVETEQRVSDVVAGGIDVAAYSDFGSDSSKHGYSIATHFVKVQSSGLLADVKSLWQLAGTDAVSQSVKTLLENTKPGFQRFSSIHAFAKVTNFSSITFLLIHTW